MSHPNRVAGEYLIGFADDVTDGEAFTRQILSTQGGRALAVWPRGRGFVGALPDGAVQALRRHPRIQYIEANVTMKDDDTACGAPTCQVIGVNDNWGLDRIDQIDNPLDGWNAYGTNGTGVHIWILEADGLDGGNPEIASRVDHSISYAFAGGDPFTVTCSNHGTSVAIMAAGTTYGVAKGAYINSARLGPPCPNGSTLGALTSALYFIADNTPRPAVINRSAGYVGTSLAVTYAVNYAVNSGVAVVVSAGNDNQSACNQTPASVPLAITVAASGRSDTRASFSNYGTCVDLFAPGIDLQTGYELFSGTSASAPLVAGVAAMYLQQAPTATAAQVASFLVNTATVNTLTTIGAGSPNRLLHSRPAGAAPTVTSAVTNPSPAKQYLPFSLTINGSGFDPLQVEIVVIAPSGCSTNYESGCVAIVYNNSINTKTSTQLIVNTLSFSIVGTKDVYVRNGRNGVLAGPRQIVVNPMY